MTTKKRTRLAALALTPAVLILSACTLDFNMIVKADGSGTAVVDFQDDSGQLKSLGMTCKDLTESTESDDSWKIEDLSKGNTIHCRMSGEPSQIANFTDNHDGTITISDNGEGSSSTGGAYLDQVDVTFTFNMPGKVVEASGDNTIDGNKVIYKGSKVLENGFTITSQTDGSSSSGFPAWGFGLIAVGAAAALGGVVFAMRRSKKPENPPAMFSMPSVQPEMTANTAGAFNSPVESGAFAEPENTGTFAEPVATEPFEATEPAADPEIESKPNNPFGDAAPNA